MLQISTSMGNIYYSDELIRNVIFLATLECNGVVCLTNKNFKESDVESFNSSVKISLTNGKLNVQVFIIIKYGIKVSIIANEVIQKIKDVIEKGLGLGLNSIIVNVQGVRYED